MAIKGLLYICILFVASVSLVSYKRGVYLIWLTLLLVPPIILLSGVKLKLSLMTILMAGSFISEMRYSVSRNNFVTFFRDNQKAILLYLLVSFSIVFLSQTVPIGYQLRRLFDEIVMLLFALQTYLLVKAKGEVSKTLMWIICGILLFNFVYCIYFEVLLGINPAGLPLYLLMGVDNSEFVVDMVESERGGLGFRAQTVYGHALSLGQYQIGRAHV